MKRCLALAGLLLIAGCPADDDDVDTTPMAIAGTFSLAGAIAQSDCVGGDWDFWEVFGFMEHTPNDVPAIALDVTQDGGALDAWLTPGECGLIGTVDAAGNFHLGGAYNDGLMNRDVDISALATPYGGNWDVEGQLTVSVDRDDGQGGPPDGVVDCVVQRMDLTGTGAPTND